MGSVSVITNNNPVKIGSVGGKSLSLSFLLRKLDLSFLWRILRKKYSLHGKWHDPKAMFRALLIKELRQISSRRKLAKFLRKDSAWLEKCGLDGPITHNAFYKFVKRVGADGFEEIFNELVKQINEIRPLGKIVAVDSTSIKAYSRYQKNKENSDPDSAWGITIKNGKQEWIYGFKVHIIADAELELPLGFEVTPANVYDSTRYQALLTDLMGRGIEPETVLADKGYDTKSNYAFTLDHGAIPIVAMNPRNLKKRRKRDFEADFPIQRNSDEWKKLYRKRGAVERVNSRLKEELDLKAVKVRGLDNVKIHAAISLITMLVVALVALRSGNGHLSASVNSFKF
jgi:transposase